MAMSESYGEAFGKRLNARASAFVTRALPRSTIAATELRYENPRFTLSTPPAPEDAFVVAVHLERFDRYEYWEDGKAAPVSTIGPGETIIYDIRRQPTFHLNSPFHSVHFYLPTSALHALADEAETDRVDALRYSPAVPFSDPVLRGMAEALLPAFARPGEVSRLLMDHSMLAVGHHIACTYGGMRPFRIAAKGGLTPLQERRAKEFLAANLTGDLALADVAGQCGLSASQFSKAFRKSVGMPPHRWLIQQRIARAKSLLRREDATLAEIALMCGFSSQSHFTHAFTSWTGFSPAAWRRAARG